MINNEKYTVYPSSPTQREIRDAFSLVELLITISIVGILAAIIMPTFQAHAQEAKESAAKDNLRILRNAIEIYASKNNGIPPGYPGNDSSQSPSNFSFSNQMTGNGKYLSELPKNPLNTKSTINLIDNNEAFPTEPVLTNLYGWIYKPQTKEVRLNWSGTDSQGVLYFDY